VATGTLPRTGPILPRQFLAWSFILIGLGLLIVRPRRGAISTG
jgi:hypothetical protein